MTDPNKAAVLAKWPDAYAQYHRLWDSWTIESDQFTVHGNGDTEPEAWADAARRLK